MRSIAAVAVSQRLRAMVDKLRLTAKLRKLVCLDTICLSRRRSSVGLPMSTPPFQRDPVDDLALIPGTAERRQTQSVMLSEQTKP